MISEGLLTGAFCVTTSLCRFLQFEPGLVAECKVLNLVFQGTHHISMEGL